MERLAEYDGIRTKPHLGDCGKKNDAPRRPCLVGGGD
jgi:FPC/CPF motif-containing protein YcgG